MTRLSRNLGYRYFVGTTVDRGFRCATVSSAKREKNSANREINK